MSDSKRHWTDGPDARGRYRSASGRYISRQEWEHWVSQLPSKPRKPRKTDKAKQKEIKQHIDKRSKRKSKGEVSPRKPSKKQREKAKQELKQEKLPKSAQTVSKRSTSKGRAAKYEVYRFEGIEAESDVRQLLYIVRDSGKASLTAVNIGTGYGRDADWIGSTYDRPSKTLIYMGIWTKRPSAQAILEQHDNGAPLWWEVEVMWLS